MGVERILGVILNYASFVLSAFFAQLQVKHLIIMVFGHCYVTIIIEVTKLICPPLLHY